MHRTINPWRSQNVFSLSLLARPSSHWTLGYERFVVESSLRTSITHFTMRRQQRKVGRCSNCHFPERGLWFLDDFYKIVDLMLIGSNQEEIGIAVAKMDERFERARKILQEIPGLQYTKEEQEAILQREMEVVKTKQQHLKQYTELPPFQALPEQP